MRRRRIRSAAAALAALVIVGLSAQGGGATTGAAARTPIRHLVVMTQDQRSFDNYFGMRAGVDGISGGICVPVKVGSSTPCVAPFPLEGSGLRPNLRATAAAQQVSVANGRMDGFVLAQTTPHINGKGAMGYYQPTDLPVATQLADQGVLFDRWFSSVPGGTIANRLFAVSGAAVPDIDQVPAAGWPNLPLIFDRLQAAGVSWKVYVERYEPALTITTAGPKARRGGQVARVPLLAMTRYEKNADLASHVVDLDTYFSDLAAGALPAVSWIVTTSSTERAPGEPQLGQRVVRNVVNALGGSSAWPSSAFFLSYDSSGGWYDHVAPPTEHGAVLGLRVPALMISPYATPGTVNHRQFDSASVLRFIETNWSVAPLTSRDASAADLGTAMSFGRTPYPATIVGTTGGRPQAPIPNRLIIYGVYLMALVAVGAVVAWVAWRSRRVVSSLASPGPT